MARVYQPNHLGSMSSMKIEKKSDVFIELDNRKSVRIQVDKDRISIYTINGLKSNLVCSNGCPGIEFTTEC